MDFSQFSQIIDLLGGVQLELREDEAAEINKETGSGLSAGVQVLNGEQALTYARIRKLDADGDFSRTSRQRKLMNALLGSYRNIKWKDLLPLIDELLPLISTDMNYGRLVLLAMEILPKLSDAQIDAVADALEALCADDAMKSKYNVSGVAPLLFAVGDGNHSLATAKACYEEQKKGKTPEEYLALPARYALVEVVNNHDDALQFEPIHRVLFGVDHENFMTEFQKFYPNAHEGKGEGHVIEFVWEGVDKFITVPDPKVQLAVGTLQAFIDEYLKKFGGEVDYIHGDEVTKELGGKPGNMGFLLPAMGKEQLFKTVMADGVLPRKTFSMGHAQDKRYYVEARKIR